MSDSPNQPSVASDDPSDDTSETGDIRGKDEKKVFVGLIVGGVVLMIAAFLVIGALPPGRDTGTGGQKTSPPVVVTIPVGSEQVEQVEEVPLSPSEWSDVLEAFWVSVSTTDQSDICEAVTLFGAEESASIVVLTISDETGGEAPTLEQAAEWLNRKCQ